MPRQLIIPDTGQRNDRRIFLFEHFGDINDG